MVVFNADDDAVDGCTIRDLDVVVVVDVDVDDGNTTIRCPITARATTTKVEAAAASVIRRIRVNTIFFFSFYTKCCSWPSSQINTMMLGATVQVDFLVP